MTSVLTAGATLDVARLWQQFINGKFESGAQPRTIYNPSLGEPLCTVADAAAPQVQEAIKSARLSFDSGVWANRPPGQRAMFLRRAADLLDARASQLSLVETLNAGKPLRESLFDIQESANCLRYFAGLITMPMGQTVDVPAPSVTRIVREPLGVCVLIVPWNYPLLTAIWKIAPALAAGNSIILKPSEFTPLTVLILAEIFQQLELPAGVFNVVLGDGISVGMPLVQSELVDKVSFTGSGKTGRAIAQAAIQSNLKKVTLELGGKSPLIIWDDVDLATAVDYALYAIFVHAGQVCSAGSRFLVHESVFERFCEQMATAAGKIRVGPAGDPQTQMGPVVSDVQLKRVLEYIESGRSEGAELLCGGDRPRGTKYGAGYYVNPTLFTNVRADMRIVQEEIFGPVATIEKFDGEEQALQLANGTVYGLAAGVLTRDTTRALRMAKALKAGVVWINGFHSCYNECPFGGYKQSGWGRECGTPGIQPYTEVKQINLNLAPQPVGWFAPSASD